MEAEWAPYVEAADEANKDLLKATAAGTKLPFYQNGDYLVLGEGGVINKDNAREYGAASGSLQIGRKGEWSWKKFGNDPGSIELVDYRGKFDQASFTEAIGRISKKAVDLESNVWAPEMFTDFWAVEPWEGAHYEFQQELEARYAGENIHFLIDLRAYRNGGMGYLGTPVDAEYLYARYFEDNCDEYINIDDALRNVILEARDAPSLDTFDEAEGKVISDMVQDLYGKWKIKNGY